VQPGAVIPISSNLLLLDDFIYFYFFFFFEARTLQGLT
jgi:hypothetical protein